VSEMKANCFVCNKEIMLGLFPEMSDKEKKENPCDGVDANITAGYGSRHDGVYGKIYVCDDCLADRLDRVIDKGDYLDEYSQEINLFDSSVDGTDKVLQREMEKRMHPSNQSVPQIKDFWIDVRKKFSDGIN
jgi:hypothetical protein